MGAGADAEGVGQNGGPTNPLTLPAGEAVIARKALARVQLAQEHLEAGATGKAGEPLKDAEAGLKRLAGSAVKDAGAPAVEQTILWHAMALTHAVRRKMPLEFLTLQPPRDAAFPAAVERGPAKEIAALLRGVDSWEFDIFRLQELTGDRSLLFLSWHLLKHRWGLVDKLGVDEVALLRYLTTIEWLYGDVTYHNKTHASDVLQACHVFLCQYGVEDALSDLEKFSLLVGAIVHDVEHDGRNNMYHANAQTDRCKMFEGQAIQESYHLALALGTLSVPELNFWHPWDQATVDAFTRQLGSAVLSTDMGKHFKLLEELDAAAEIHGADLLATQKGSAYVVDLMHRLTLHVADISNPMRPTRLAARWSRVCIDEFFEQGDLEKAQQLKVSMLCDRDTTSFPGSQIGFIDFIVAPTLEKFGKVLPKLRPALKPLLDQNRAHWVEVKAAADSSAGDEEKK